MQQAMDLRDRIKLRLEEKRKLANARHGVTWLWIVVSGLIMFTFLRVVLLFSSGRAEFSVFFTVAFLALIGSVYSLWRAKRFIKENELSVARTFVLISMVSGSLLIVFLIAGFSAGFGGMKFSHHIAPSGLHIFFYFYLLNVVIGMTSLFLVYKALKKFEIHSMNMSSYHKSLSFWFFLAAGFSVFLLFVAW